MNTDNDDSSEKKFYFANVRVGQTGLTHYAVLATASEFCSTGFSSAYDDDDVLLIQFDSLENCERFTLLIHKLYIANIKKQRRKPTKKSKK